MCWCASVCIQHKLFTSCENVCASSSSPCTHTHLACLLGRVDGSACVFVCVSMSSQVNVSKNEAYYGAYLRLQIPPLVQVSACFVFPVSQWSLPLTQCSLYALAVHATATPFETKHTPVTQTNRPLSPLNPLRNSVLRQRSGKPELFT